MHETPDHVRDSSRLGFSFAAYPGKGVVDGAQPKVRRFLFPTLFRVAGDLVSTARAKELLRAVQEEPALAKRMHLALNFYPKASDHLGAFLGFFETEFRRFDYYLGMYDAYRTFFRLYKQELGIQHPRDFTPTDVAAMTPAWRPFACMLGWYDGHKDFRTACAGEDLEDFRILLQVSLDRLYQHCAGKPDVTQHWEHNHCRRAAMGRATPRVIPKLEDEGMRRRGESHFDHTMRLLADYGFAFRDLGIERSHASHGLVAIRRKLLKITKAIANKQNAAERALLLTLGRQVVNAIAYEPPRHWAYVVLGSSVEVGGSFLPFDWRDSWARAQVALRIQDLSSYLTPERDVSRYSLVAGVELQPLFLATPQIQSMLGFRGGLQMSTDDDFWTQDCHRPDNRQCSQWTIEAYLALGLIERVRFQVTSIFYPFRSHRKNIYDLDFGIGVQFF